MIIPPNALQKYTFQVVNAKPPPYAQRAHKQTETSIPPLSFSSKTQEPRRKHSSTTEPTQDLQQHNSISHIPKSNFFSSPNHQERAETNDSLTHVHDNNSSTDDDSSCDDSPIGALLTKNKTHHSESLFFAPITTDKKKSLPAIAPSPAISKRLPSKNHLVEHDKVPSTETHSFFSSQKEESSFSFTKYRTTTSTSKSPQVSQLTTRECSFQYDRQGSLPEPQEQRLIKTPSYNSPSTISRPSPSHVRRTSKSPTINLQLAPARKPLDTSVQQNKVTAISPLPPSVTQMPMLPSKNQTQAEAEASKLQRRSLTKSSENFPDKQGKHIPNYNNLMVRPLKSSRGFILIKPSLGEYHNQTQDKSPKGNANASDGSPCTSLESEDNHTYAWSSSFPNEEHVVELKSHRHLISANVAKTGNSTFFDHENDDSPGSQITKRIENIKMCMGQPGLSDLERRNLELSLLKFQRIVDRRSKIMEKHSPNQNHDKAQSETSSRLTNSFSSRNIET